MNHSIPPATRAYRDTNRALVLMLLFAVVWSFLTLWLRHRLSLPLNACVSQVWLHTPCPLCGVTRGLWALLQGHGHDARVFNPLTLPIAVIFTVELGYRACGATSALAARLTRFRRLDAWLHGALAFGYLAYTVAFYAWHLGTAAVNG